MEKKSYYINLLKKQAIKVGAKYFSFFNGYNFTADDGNEYQTIFNENLKSFIVRLWTGATYKTVAILKKEYYGEI
jgi:hypothetical protein